jgi:hypothetical protein
VSFIVIALSFGLAAGIIARAKGSSFLIWFAIGTALSAIGPLGGVLALVAVVLYRSERDEPERRCPRCGAVHKLYVQVCSVCGEDMFLPDPADVRQPSAR